MSGSRLDCQMDAVRAMRIRHTIRAASAQGLLLD